jgi:hypothetical protein
VAAFEVKGKFGRLVCLATVLIPFTSSSAEIESVTEENGILSFSRILLPASPIGTECGQAAG